MKTIPLITPLETIPKKIWTTVLIIEVGVALILWQLSGGGLIPGPLTVLKNMAEVITESGGQPFVSNLTSSLFLTIKAMGISIVLALLFSYIAVIPLFNPIAKFIVQCRYLTLTGLIFLFTLLTKDGSQLKMSLLIFGIVPFFVTSLMSVIMNINSQEYDLCTTLRFNRWETLFEVIIVGRLDMMFEVMRQNFAISWLMITMVEGLSMSQGGLGVMLIKANKYLMLPRVFAILIIIFILGISFDFFFTTIRRWLFPYCRLQGAK
jgi:ABC-type nitrate/sulfonate/bicarbonate transport system permease component